MVDSYRTGTSRESPGGEPGFSGTEASSRAADPYDNMAARSYARRSYDERRRRQSADLFFEDSAVLLGILLGGAAGYLAATTVSRPGRSGNRSGRASERGSFGHALGWRKRSRSSVPVEKDETTDLIASSKVEGTTVYDRQGEKLGEVYNFMVGKRSGQVAYAVMSFGGFLGIGQKYHPLPWEVLTYDTDRKGYVIDADRERLMRAPSYGVGEEPFSQPDYGRQIRDYWSPSSA